jgi:hypothetical protein
LNQNTMTTGRFLLLVVVAALLAPHTFEISSQNIPDASFARYSVITLLLTVFYEYGSTIAGSYSTLFVMPPTSAALLNLLTLIVNVSIILAQWGVTKGRASKRIALYTIAAALCVHALLLLGFFSYQVNGTASALAIPLPVFPIISALLVLRGKLPVPIS